MDKDEIKQGLEAILLLGGEETKVKELSKYFKITLEDVKSLLVELKREYSNRGINIEIEDDRVYLVTNSKCGSIIHSYFNQEGKPKKLSAAALETLSIIAYKQPITKSEIELIRGVSADKVIQTLEEKGFISICGKKESMGKPNLYSLTNKFLGYFGIEKVEELPGYFEMKNKEIVEESQNNVDK